MVNSGFLESGYEYLVIDDCWSLKERDENGRLVPDFFCFYLKTTGNSMFSYEL